MRRVFSVTCDSSSLILVYLILTRASFALVISSMFALASALACAVAFRFTVAVKSCVNSLRIESLSLFSASGSSFETSWVLGVKAFGVLEAGTFFELLLVACF